tara:strand:- start:1014 stop:1328 length:315 start_codon:yes stop_codon:yes gene_type:complete
MGRDTLTREIREKQLKKIGYSFKWDHSNFIVDNTLRIAPTKDRWCWLGTEQHWNDFGDETLEEILELCDVDEHLGCFSYPMCDEAPNGCCVRMGTDVEEYGHRD